MDTGGDFRPVRFMIWDHLFFLGDTREDETFFTFGRFNKVQQKSHNWKDHQKEICSFGVPHLWSISCGSD